MINTNILTGKLVKLAAIDPEQAETWARWRTNSEYLRMANMGPSMFESVKATRAWMEKHLDDWLEHEFSIRTLDGDQLIGSTGLGGNLRTHAEAFVGIGIGDPDFWGKGYGSEAMRLILGYAFQELNLQRVSLDVFEYNPRAIHSYEKVGFKHEGRMRGALLREGRRWDMFFMGILREEWLLLQTDPPTQTP
jgi:RimJ/RimL family protein N-acetyltransferase